MKTDCNAPIYSFVDMLNYARTGSPLEGSQTDSTAKYGWDVLMMPLTSL